MGRCVALDAQKQDLHRTADAIVERTLGTERGGVREASALYIFFSADRGPLLRSLLPAELKKLCSKNTGQTTDNSAAFFVGHLF